MGAGDLEVTEERGSGVGARMKEEDKALIKRISRATTGFRIESLKLFQAVMTEILIITSSKVMKEFEDMKRVELEQE